MIKIKKLICKIIGHNYQYNFSWMPTKCTCTRCYTIWRSKPNPDYIPGTSNPIVDELYIWVEEKIEKND